MKYGVMSTRNLSGALRPSRSSSVRFEDLLDLFEIVDAIARAASASRSTSHRDVGPQRRAPADRRLAIRTSRRAGSRRLTNGCSSSASSGDVSTAISSASG